MFLSALFSQATPAKGSPFDRPELLWGAAGLAGALLVGALAIYVVDRWRRRAALGDRDSGMELTSFRAMYERGEITEAEYTRLRQRVADRVKKPPVPPAPPGGPPGAPPAVLEPPPAAGPRPPVPGPFPPGYFDDPPPTSPPAEPPPPTAPGGSTPPA